jgi:hypothetical protein
MDMLEFLLMISVTGINFWIAHDVLYKVYDILMGDRMFLSLPEKVGFYIHGWASYLALFVLIFIPMITQSWAHGLIGTGFLILLRILLKGKL